VYLVQRGTRAVGRPRGAVLATPEAPRAGDSDHIIKEAAIGHSRPGCQNREMTTFRLSILLSMT
jgi:hypothetical protein